MKHGSPNQTDMPAPDGADSAVPRAHFMVPFIVALGFVLEQVDSTIVTIAIPDIAASFAVPPMRLAVLVTTYIISVAIFMPISAWAAERFGPRRVFCVAIVLFTVASIGCGSASRFETLVVGRFLQGIGGAMLTPVGRLLLLRSYSKQDRLKATNYMMLPVIIGPALGPLVGGLILAHASWRWIFYINIPLGILGILGARRFIADFAPSHDRDLDKRGFVLAAAASAMSMFALEAMAQGDLPLGYVLLAGLTGAALIIGYIAHARRTLAPLLDLSLLKLRTVAVGMGSGALCRIGMNAPIFLLPVMLQITFGLSPMAAGALTFCSALGALSGRFLTHRLLAHFGFGTVLAANAALSAAATAGFALISLDLSYWAMGIYLLLFGVMRVVQFNSVQTLIYSELEGTRLSQGTSLAGVAQQLATALGITAAASLLTAFGGAATAPSLHDFRMVVIVVAAFPLLSMLGFARLKPTDGAEASGYGRKDTPRDLAVAGSPEDLV